MIIGYARVSKDEQHLDRQLDQLNRDQWVWAALKRKKTPLNRF